MTPLEKAQELLAGIEQLAVTNSHTLPGSPRNRYAQVGNLVIACAGVTVTVVGMNPQALNPSSDLGMVGSSLNIMNCGPAQIGIFNLVIARDCANISNDDGTDNVRAIADLSPKMDADGQLLWDFCVNYEAWITKSWTSRFAIEGALAVSSVQLTTGID